MENRTKEIFKFPALFVFLSFLFGFANFFDTFLRLLFSYMLDFPYPLRVDLKPVFFILQAISFLFFTYYVATRQGFANASLWRFLRLQLAVLVTVIFLFFIYEFISPGIYGSTIYFTDTLWLVSYIMGLSATCFWFSYILFKKSRYRAFAPVFLLIGAAFILRVVSEVVFWPQSLLNFSIPSEVDVGSRLLTTLLTIAAVFYASVQLAIRKGIGKWTLLNLKNAQPYILISAFLTPFFLNYYKEGLFPLIIRAIVSWGLGYSGQNWVFTSLYLAAFVVYLFLILGLNKKLNHLAASTLILLGVASFPWNGIFVFNFGYSSIPGNMLSLIALITGFSMLQRRREQIGNRSNESLGNDVSIA